MPALQAQEKLLLKHAQAGVADAVRDQLARVVTSTVENLAARYVIRGQIVWEDKHVKTGWFQHNPAVSLEVHSCAEVPASYSEIAGANSSDHGCQVWL